MPQDLEANTHSAAIRSFLTRDQPFGPPDSDSFFVRETDGADAFFDRSNQIFAQARLRPITYIIGRKGAGKTAFLYGSTLSTTCHLEALQTPDIYSKFLATTIQYQARHAPLFVDQIAQIWDGLFYHVAAYFVCHSAAATDSHKDLQAVWDYIPRPLVEARDPTAVADWFLAAFSDRSEASPHASDLRQLISGISNNDRQFSDVKTCVSRLIRERDKRLVIIMDNLEDLHMRLADVKTVLQGLFRFIGQFTARATERDFDLRICLPSEPYEDIHRLSTNPAKDFRPRETITIYWSARELLHLAGARLQQYLTYYYPDEARSVSDRTAAAGGNQPAAFLREVLPKQIRNSLDISEDPVAYLLRHTQLIPRHLIVILNTVFARRTDGSAPWQITEAAIKNGTQEAERVIV
jgi:hypothetical protein